MSTVSIQALLTRMGHGNPNAESAQRLLAATLDRLQLPTREAYSAEEVLAIGMAITEAASAELKRSQAPEARMIVEQLGPWVDVARDEVAKLVGTRRA